MEHFPRNNDFNGALIYSSQDAGDSIASLYNFSGDGTLWVATGAPHTSPFDRYAAGTVYVVKLLPGLSCLLGCS